MRLNVNKTAYFQEGEHDAIISMIYNLTKEQSKKGGWYTTFNVVFKDVEDASVEAVQKVWDVDFEGCLLNQLITATNIPIDEQGNYETDDLIGKKVIIEVEKNGQYSNVVAVHPFRSIEEQLPTGMNDYDYNNPNSEVDHYTPQKRKGFGFNGRSSRKQSRRSDSSPRLKPSRPKEEESLEDNLNLDVTEEDLMIDVDFLDLTSDDEED